MNGLKASADTQQQRKDLVFSQEVALVLQSFYLIPQCTSLQHKFSCAEKFFKVPTTWDSFLFCVKVGYWSSRALWDVEFILDPLVL